MFKVSKLIILISFFREANTSWFMMVCGTLIFPNAETSMQAKLKSLLVTLVVKPIHQQLWQSTHAKMTTEQYSSTTSNVSSIQKLGTSTCERNSFKQSCPPSSY